MLEHGCRTKMNQNAFKHIQKIAISGCVRLCVCTMYDPLFGPEIRCLILYLILKFEF